MDARLPALTAEELGAVGAGLKVVGDIRIVEEIKKILFHEHDSKRDVWRDYGGSTVR